MMKRIDIDTGYKALVVEDTQAYTVSVNILYEGTEENPGCFGKRIQIKALDDTMTACDEFFDAYCAIQKRTGREIIADPRTGEACYIFGEDDIAKLKAQNVWRDDFDNAYKAARIHVLESQYVFKNIFVNQETPEALQEAADRTKEQGYMFIINVSHSKLEYKGR